MAKLKGPLMSLGASGAIGKTLIFFGWKGIDAVREYVVPSNPKTGPQITQRTYLSEAVAMVHTAQARAANALSAADQTAYSALAAVKGAIETWFNRACKLWLDVAVAGDTPCIYSDGQVTTPTPAAIDMIMYLNEETPSDLVAGKFYFGSSKSNLIHAKVATVVAGVSVALVAENCSAFLTAGTKYYWQFRPDAADPCEGADSGIYYFTAT